MKILLSVVFGFSLLLSSITALQPRPLQVQQLGQSTAGHPLEVYRFGSGEKRVVLIGGIHGGYEWNTVELAWQLIDHFTAYPTLVPKALTVEIVPVANPDGLARVMGSSGRIVRAKINGKVDPYLGRFNSNTVDLNRNWDCEWQAKAQGPRGAVSGGKTTMSEVETQLLAELLMGSDVVGVIFWHSSANGVYAGACEEEFPAATQLAQVYAAGSKYPFRQAFTSYPITGDATNWLAQQGIPSVVVELRTQTQSEFDQNLRGVQAVLKYYAAKNPSE